MRRLHEGRVNFVLLWLLQVMKSVEIYYDFEPLQMKSVLNTFIFHESDCLLLLPRASLFLNWNVCAGQEKGGANGDYGAGESSLESDMDDSDEDYVLSHEAIGKLRSQGKEKASPGKSLSLINMTF